MTILFSNIELTAPETDTSIIRRVEVNFPLSLKIFHPPERQDEIINLFNAANITFRQSSDHAITIERRLLRQSPSDALQLLRNNNLISTEFCREIDLFFRDELISSLGTSEQRSFGPPTTTKDGVTIPEILSTLSNPPARGIVILRDSMLEPTPSASWTARPALIVEDIPSNDSLNIIQRTSTNTSSNEAVNRGDSSMTKYVIQKSWGNVSWRNLRSRHDGRYLNSSDAPIITSFILIGGRGGDEGMFLKISVSNRDYKTYANKFLADLPPAIRVLFDDTLMRLGYTNETLNFAIPDRLMHLFPDVIRALDRLDPFDNSLKQEMEQAFGIQFGFSNEDLQNLLTIDTDEALTQLQQRSPWQIFTFAEIKRQHFEEQENITETEMFSFIKAYAAVGEQDPKFKVANEIIYSFIMAQELKAFPKDVQFKLRGEKLRATLKLGNLDELYYLLPALCGYNLTDHPFPPMSVVNVNELATQMISMAEHIQHQNEEIESLKAENSNLRSTYQPRFFSEYEHCDAVASDYECKNGL